MLGKRLKYGDTIGIISPASCEDSNIINEKIEFLKCMGFNIRIGNHVYDKYGYLAGNDISRAEDFMNSFLDNSIDAIMCFRGGYGTMRMLPYIDFKLLKDINKIFIGFSDITTLLNTLYMKTNLITFHGPMVSSDFKDKTTLDNFLNILMNGHKQFLLNNPKDIPLNFYGKENCEGILIGGNLSLICSTIGTPYEIDFNNKILFIEDVDEPPYSIDRMLTQLKLSGKLEQCVGFILGQFTGCHSNQNYSFKLKEVIDQKILSLERPTITNLMCGHGNPKLTLPIGAKIKIDIENKNIKICEPVVL